MTAQIINNRVAGTRITVWDVLHYLEGGWSRDKIAEVLGLSTEQVEAAVRFIDENRDDVMSVHREIEDRNARGNPPEIRVKIVRTQAKMQQWLAERLRLKEQEKDRAGHSGRR